MPSGHSRAQSIDSFKSLFIPRQSFPCLHLAHPNFDLSHAWTSLRACARVFAYAIMNVCVSVCVWNAFEYNKCGLNVWLWMYMYMDVYDIVCVCVERMSQQVCRWISVVACMYITAGDGRWNCLPSWRDKLCRWKATRLPFLAAYKKKKKIHTLVAPLIPGCYFLWYFGNKIIHITFHHCCKCQSMQTV